MSRAESYARMFDKAGRRVVIERRVPNAPTVRAENVRARIRGASPEEVAGGIQATERKVLILAADVPAAMLPLLTNDAVVVDGLTLRFTSRPDDQTHRDGDTLLAIEAIAAGG